MAQSTVSIRMDEELKKRVERLAEAFGMNITTLITVCLKAVDRERRIPFEVAVSEPPYNEVTRRAIADVNAGIGLSKPYKSWADAKAAMDEEDDDEEI